MAYEHLWQNEHFRKAFQRWWDEDWSWEGLGEKYRQHSLGGPPDQELGSLQEVWRATAGRQELIDFGGRKWTRFHLPPFDRDGNPCPSSRWQSAKHEGYAKSLAGYMSRAQIPADEMLQSFGLDAVTQFAELRGVVWPESFAIEGAALVANLQSAVFLGRFSYSKRILARFDSAAFSDDAQFDNATFGADAHFDNAAFSGRARFDGTTFSKDAQFNDAIFSGSAWFNGANFSGEAQFGGAIFSGDAQLGRASFSGTAWFVSATFSATASFSTVTFSKAAWFANATFLENAWFRGATFLEDAQFAGATFGYVRFDGVIFTEDALFGGATFSDGARFGNATFSRDAWFGNVTFSGTAWFADTIFSGDVRFDGATFSGDAWFASATFSGDVRFAGAAFSGDADFRGTKPFSKSVSFAKSPFRRGVDFSGREFKERTDFSLVRFGGVPKFHGARLHPDTSFLNARFPGAGCALPPLSLKWFCPEFFRSHDEEEEKRQRVAARSRFAQWMRWRGKMGPKRWRHRPWRRVRFGGLPFAMRWNPELEVVNAARNKDTEEYEIAYRRLRRLSAEIGSIEYEGLFHALELKAHRARTDTHGLARLASWLYEVLSDYGRSMARPLVALLNAWLLAVILYAACFTPPYDAPGPGMSAEACRMTGWPPGSEVWVSAAREFLPSLFGMSNAANRPEWLRCAEGAHPLLFFAVNSLQIVVFIACVSLFLIALRRRFQLRE